VATSEYRERIEWQMLCLRWENGEPQYCVGRVALDHRTHAALWVKWNDRTVERLEISWISRSGFRVCSERPASRATPPVVPLLVVEHNGSKLRVDPRELVGCRFAIPREEPKI
jgi:hypothetical protein